MSRIVTMDLATKPEACQVARDGTKTVSGETKTKTSGPKTRTLGLRTKTKTKTGSLRHGLGVGITE